MSEGQFIERATLDDWSERDQEQRDRIKGLEAKLAKAVKSLTVIDALDPEGFVNAYSQSALKGLVLRMGEVARATLVELKGL